MSGALFSTIKTNTMNSKVANVIKWTLLALLASVAIWQLALLISDTLDSNQVISRLTFGLIVSFLAILLVAVLFRYDKKKPGHKLGFIGHSKRFLAGVGWYVVPAILGLIIASFFGVVEVSINASPIEATSAILLVAVLVLLSEALPEEIIFRGYVFSKLTVLSGRWTVIFLQAAVFTGFAFMIGALNGLLDASFIFTFGLVLGILRMVTGSVAAPIGFHLACMITQQSFSSQWSPFAATDSSILQTFIFGMIPISITIAYFSTKVAKANKRRSS